MLTSFVSVDRALIRLSLPVAKSIVEFGQLVTIGAAPKLNAEQLGIGTGHGLNPCRISSYLRVYNNNGVAVQTSPQAALSCVSSLQIGVSRVHGLFRHVQRSLQLNDHQITEQSQTMLEERTHHQD